ncbi:MAG: ribonuclease III [Rikenellaceae bacterium]|nr:ribonuclease III [Rikenellaceae bacterium]
MFGFIPHNIELYKLALIHKSASVVLADGQHINNERLEFLGDAVLESVSSDYLFIEFPDKNEGFLTKLRSKMVSRQMLNEVAKRIGLDSYVITHSSSNLSQKHIYGDAFEAMMGAIYLDQGYDFVNRLLINKIFVEYIKVDQLTQSETDFKSRLIEWCQKNHHAIHFDTVNDKTYSSTHPFFYSKVLIDGIEMGYGAGESKKEAEQRAAYSVSQGFNDDDCTKLLDKLDTIDARAKQRSKSEPKQESKIEPKQEHKSEVKAEVKVEPKAEVKSESKPAAKSEQKPATKLERKAEKSSEPKADGKVEPKADTKTESKAEPKAAPKVETTVESKSEQTAERKPRSKPKSKANAKSEQKSEQKSAKITATELTELAEPAEPAVPKAKRTVRRRPKKSDAKQSSVTKQSVTKQPDSKQPKTQQSEFKQSSEQAVAKAE